MSGMLTVINLFVIDKIFNEVAETKIGANARALYVNCLTQHFRTKPASVSGAIAFEIFESDFGDFEKYRKSMEELHKAGLVTLGNKTVCFNNVWGQLIDRTKLEKVSPDEYVAGFQFNLSSKYKEELLNSKDLFELCAMKYKVGQVQYKKLIDLFVQEQDTFEKKYLNFPECKKHCSYWIGTNSDKIPKEFVKSNSKILGG